MLDQAHYSATETLPDGLTLTIRSQTPNDREGWLAALARSSAETLYHRFFGVKREFSEKELHFFLDIDFIKHVALVVEVEENGKPTLIGGGRYVTIEPGRAEVSFALIDDYQHKGIGSVLMRHLAKLAKKAGLKQLVAEVLSDNLPMVTVFEHSGLPMTLKREGAVIHVTMQVPP